MSSAGFATRTCLRFRVFPDGHARTFSGPMAYNSLVSERWLHLIYASDWILRFFRAVTTSVFIQGHFEIRVVSLLFLFHDSDVVGSPKSQGLDDYPPARRVFEACSRLPVPLPDQAADLPHHRFTGLRWVKSLWQLHCHPLVSKEMPLPLRRKTCFVPSYPGPLDIGHSRMGKMPKWRRSCKSTKPRARCSSSTSPPRRCFGEHGWTAGCFRGVFPNKAT